MTSELVGLGITLLLMVALFAAGWRLAGWWYKRPPTRAHPPAPVARSQPVKPRVPDPAILASLRQNLRLKLSYDETKIDRLLQLEREKMPNASLQQLMQSAIERWERDNR
jgi:hypothetical protein